MRPWFAQLSCQFLGSCARPWVATYAVKSANDRGGSSGSGWRCKSANATCGGNPRTSFKMAGIAQRVGGYENTTAVCCKQRSEGAMTVDCAMSRRHERRAAWARACAAASLRCRLDSGSFPSEEVSVTDRSSWAAVNAVLGATVAETRAASRFANHRVSVVCAPGCALAAAAASVILKDS